jgi:hypothetical protein
MVSDVDLLRSAKVVLDQHGPDALIHWAQQADKVIAKGDVQGYEVWCAILALLASARAQPEIEIQKQISANFYFFFRFS